MYTLRTRRSSWLFCIVTVDNDFSQSVRMSSTLSRSIVLSDSSTREWKCLSRQLRRACR